jgi:hypothetical protein
MSSRSSWSEAWLGFRMRTASHGVTTKATSSEKTIAALAPMVSFSESRGG